MKRISFYCAVLTAMLFTGVFSGVQAQSFEQGKIIVSGGYGVGNITKSILKSLADNDNYKLTSTGPFFAKFEYAVSDKIGLGVNVAHIGLKPTYDISYYDSESERTVTTKGGYDWKNTSILGRINVHFVDHEKLDAYWGAGIGYRFGGTKVLNENEEDLDIPGVFPFGFESTVGIRYYFIPNLGVYAEVGIAKAVAQFGISGAF